MDGVNEETKGVVRQCSSLINLNLKAGLPLGADEGKEKHASNLPQPFIDIILVAFSCGPHVLTEMKRYRFEDWTLYSELRKIT